MTKSPPKCKTCNDEGRILELVEVETRAAPFQSWRDCPDCTPPKDRSASDKSSEGVALEKRSSVPNRFYAGIAYQDWLREKRKELKRNREQRSPQITPINEEK